MTGVLMAVCVGALVWSLSALFVTLCDLTDCIHRQVYCWPGEGRWEKE